MEQNITEKLSIYIALYSTSSPLKALTVQLTTGARVCKLAVTKLTTFEPQYNLCETLICQYFVLIFTQLVSFLDV